MFNKIIKIIGGDPNKRQIEEYAEIAEAINELEPAYEAISDEDLRRKTDTFKKRLAEGETLDDILPEAFATVREASKRTIGLRHYDIQLIGGITLHEGKIGEMKTGEGKTLVATLPLYLNALKGKGVHLVTVNDYLARRDARWMAPIYDILGLSIGVLQMAARTESGKKAFIVDLEKSSPHEDQHQLVMVPRKQAYAADITYGTTSEFGFDYLRDNMAMRLENRVQRGHHYAIIDEVDNVLIDEARTPLIISGPSHDDAENYLQMARVVKQLNPEDYEIDERSRSVALTEIGEIHVEQILGEPLRDPERPEDITPEQAQKLGYLEQAMRAQFIFKRNKDYLVQGGKVVIVDENTGRLMPGRRWSDGLHQAVEAKENVKVQSENVTYATITIQNYFRMYDKLAGMTGTAATEAEEFDEIYDLNVLEIPTNLEYVAQHPETLLIELKDRDKHGYEYTYYAHEDDPSREAIFWKRKDYPDVVYRTEEAKFRALGREIMRFHAMGRPMLVGTTSVELSERLSGRLKSDDMRKLAQVMLIRDHWLEQNNREEDGRLIEDLQFLNRPLNLLPPNDTRNMARELGISLSPLTSENLDRLLQILQLDPQYKDRLAILLKSGVSHQVLNARKHTEESQIIAGAGAYGAVTIATNMAGRGVDIKLGGELPEEIISTVNRVLHKAGYDDPYSMTMEEREEELKKMESEEYGIYDAEINEFLKYMRESRLVKELGGLHVIGSERHEARRIDNQLRGRAARQGDPGSSRFYLSMQDDLMRLFGGQQAESLMGRLKIDDDMPIEMGMVSRLVEQSQTRVEGANFDVRKHLLEYDDVLNQQRETIYNQRDRIFTKDDLSEDIYEMLRTEVEKRVPEAIQDPEGPWKLLSWLDQIQPPMTLEGEIFPSYTQQLILDYLEEKEVIHKDSAAQALLEIAESAIQAEEEHLILAFNQSLDGTYDRLEAQIKERLDTLDIFIEGLMMEDESEAGMRSTRDLQNELTALLRVPINLTPTDARILREDPDQGGESINERVESFLTTMTARRLVAMVERLMGDELDLDFNDLTMDDWDEVGDQILDRIEEVFEKRHELYLGDEKNGLISKDIRKGLERISEPITDQHLVKLLIDITQGARATFDRKTRRRVWMRTTRLRYPYFASDFLAEETDEAIIEDVLNHLEDAQDALRRGWGEYEWSQLSNSPVENLPKKIRAGLRHNLGEQKLERNMKQPLNKIPSVEVETMITALGGVALTEVHRQLMLGVISELWIDYLTQMEALRVSVGLEAYAQRDPLVQYKSKASELFQELIQNTRTGVVSRMFTYRPRELQSLQPKSISGDKSGDVASEVISPTDGAAQKPEPVGVTAQKESSQRSRRKKKMSRSQKRRRNRRRNQ